MRAAALAAGLVLLGATGAQAAPILGSLWAVPDAVAAFAVPGNVPVTPPDVTFEVNAPLNFNAGLAPTVNDFLLSGAAFNIVGDAAALSRPLSNGIIGTLIEFTGFVTVVTGQQFTVTHDDGLSLIIGGVDLGFFPGPTAPVQSIATYNGPSGTFPFQLVYGECCAGAAVLQVDLPFTPVPEPGTLVLLGTGTAVAAVRRRRTAR